MKIQRARLCEVPALAWVAAEAFAAETSKAGLHRRARYNYLMHLYSLALLTCSGKVWHWEKKAIIAIEHKRPATMWRWILPALVGATAAVALAAWIVTADAQGLQVLLAVMAAGCGLMVLVLLLLLPAVIPALREMHPSRSARNAEAIRLWRKTLPRREAYKISYLAMYPQTREGLAFAKAAIDQNVPAGAHLYIEARSEAHKAIYASRGFRQLATADGTPTLAMGSR